MAYFFLPWEFLHNLLCSIEIIKEVEKDGDRLNELLSGYLELEPDCLPRALLAAVMTGNHSIIGKLVIKGAANIEEALRLATTEKKHQTCAMLLLVMAAMNNDHSIVLKLFGEPVPNQKGREISEEGLQEVQTVVRTGKVSTVIPMEIAQHKQSRAVREELLLRTDVNQLDGSVLWHGLQLKELEVAWLRKIQWVKRLHLARNGFKTLPVEIGSCLRHVSASKLIHTVCLLMNTTQLSNQQFLPL